MKRILLKTLFCFFLIMPLVAPQFVYAQQKDSVINTITESENVEDDEFNLFLMMFALAGLSLMAGCFIVGLIITILALLFLTGLISFGVLSTSVLVGYYKRSFSTGFKTFIMMGSCIACAIMGLLGFTLIVKLFELDISRQTALLSGAIIGVLGGLLLGWAAYKMIRLVLGWITKKIKSI